LDSRPNPAVFLRRLCTGRGLYFLGAGASAGEAPFGASFLRDPLIDFLCHAGSFSIDRPEHPPLSSLLLDAGARLTAFDIDGRTLRPGTEDRTPPNFARSYLMHRLAVPRYHRRESQLPSVPIRSTVAVHELQPRRPR
jgi:hypothetical protein